MKKEERGKDMKKKRLYWISSAVVIVLVAVLATVLALLGSSQQTETASEESEVREALLAEGTATVELSGELTFDEALTVNGDKTLVGGTITVSQTVDSMLIVTENSSLTLDGTVLYGASKAKIGVTVEKGGVFTLESGKITLTTRQAIRTSGTVIIHGGMILDCGSNWLYLAEGASATIMDGEFDTCTDAGLNVLSGAQLVVSGGTYINAGSSTIFNRGTTTVTGGVITNSGNYAISNQSEAAISNLEIATSLDRGDVYNFPEATLTMTDCTLHDSAGYSIYNNGTAVLTNVVIENTVKSSINNQTADADLTLIDCQIIGAGSNGIYNKEDAVLAIDTLSIIDSTNHAIYNRAGIVEAKDLTMENAGGSVFCNDSLSDNDNDVFGSVVLDGFVVSGAEAKGITCYGGTLTLKNGTVDVCGDQNIYIKNGKATLSSVTVKGSTNQTDVCIAIGITGYEDAVVTMRNVKISGGARGISNHGTLTFYSGTISGNKNNGDDINYGGGVYNFNSFTMYGGTICGNTSAKGGAGIMNAGKAYLYGGTISSNTSKTQGGGIYNSTKGTAYLNGVTIKENTSGMDKGGAGVYNLGTMVISGDTVISNNESGGAGGGVMNSTTSDKTSIGTLTINGGTISGNTAEGSGGGIFSSGNLTINGGTISGNSAGDEKYGGGLYSSGNLSITGGTISDNATGLSGGGIFITGENNSITNVCVTGNVAGRNGGGISCSDPVTITDSTITGNSAENSGGGIYCLETATLTNVTIEKNTATKNGGGLLMSGNGSLESVTIANNLAMYNGGGFYCSSNVSVKNSTWTGNQSENNGASAYVTSDGVLSVTDTKVTNGEATGKAGGIFIYRGSATLTRVTMTDNEAAGNGIGIYNSSGELKIVDGSYTRGSASSEGYIVHGYTDKSNVKPIFILSGTVKIESMYLSDGVTIDLASALKSGSSVAVKLNSTKGMSSRQILTGSTSDVKKSAPYVSILNTSETYAYSVDEDGTGSSVRIADAATASAVVVLRNGKEVYTGTLANAIAQAESGDVLELRGDATVSSKIVLDKDITIQSSGNYTIYINTTKATGIQIEPGVTLTINGTNSNPITISRTTGESKYRAISVSAASGENGLEAATLVMNYVTVKGLTNNTNNAGAINVGGNLMAKNCTFQDCHVTATEGTSGGALYVTSQGIATMTDCVIKNCSSTKNGGGIYCLGTLSLKDVTMTGNIAAGNGGALYATSAATIVIENSKLTGNQATLGSSIYAYGSSDGGGAAITLSGSPVIDEIYLYTTTNVITLNSALNSSASVGLTARKCKVGYTVLTGNASAVASSCEAFAILNSDAQWYVDEDGLIAKIPEVIEAVLYNSDGEELAANELAVILEKATDGDVVVLWEDATISSKISISQNITIQSNGEAHTIYLDSLGSYSLDFAAGTVCAIDGSNGVITLTTTNEETTFAPIAVRGELTIKNVLITGFHNTNTTSDKGVQSAAINMVSTGVLTMENCTVKDCTSEGEYGSVYVGGNSSSNAVLTLGGLTQIDEVYLSYTSASMYRNIALAQGGLSEGSAVNVTMATATIGLTVLTGTEEDISDSCEAFTILNANAQWYVDTKGSLDRVSEVVEAILYNSDGEQLAADELAVIFGKATDGDVIALQEDVTISSKISVSRNITITSNGDAHTIYMDVISGYSLDFAAGTECAIDGSNGEITLSTSLEEKAYTSIAVRGELTLTQVTVTGLVNTKTSGDTGTQAGAINIVSTGSLILHDSSITQCTSATNYGQIYISSNSSAAGSLSLGGTVVIEEVYLSHYSSSSYPVITLTKAISEGSAIGVTLKSAEAGLVVLSGEGIEESAAYVTILNDYDSEGGEATWVINAEGLLKLAAKEEEQVEAVLYSADGAEISSGDFADMMAAAQSGYVVELHEDVTISSKISVSSDITITSNGDAHTIYMDVISGYSLDFAAGTECAIDGSNGEITLSTSLEEKAYTSIAVRGELTLTQVTVTGLVNTKTSGDTGTQAGAINIVSTGSLILHDSSITQCTSATNYGQIYISSNSSAAGSLSLGGTVVIEEVYLSHYSSSSYPVITLTKAISEGSAIGVTLKSAEAGLVVLSGEGIEESAAYVTILNDYDSEGGEATWVINAEGLLKLAAKEEEQVEAVLYSADGAEISSGDFADMMAAAQSGYVVELHEDVTISKKISVSSDLTITSDGGEHTIYFDTLGAYSLDFAAGTVCAIDGSNGRITLTTTNESITYVPIAVRAKLTLNNVVVVGFHNTNTTSDKGVQAAAINMVSTGALTMVNCTVKDCSSAGGYGSVYVGGNSSSSAVLTIGGLMEIDQVYLSYSSTSMYRSITLMEEGLSEGSAIGVWMAKTTVALTVLKGDNLSENLIYFTILNDYDSENEQAAWGISEEGLLCEAEEEVVAQNLLLCGVASMLEEELIGEEEEEIITLAPETEAVWQDDQEGEISVEDMVNSEQLELEEDASVSASEESVEAIDISKAMVVAVIKGDEIVVTQQ